MADVGLDQMEQQRQRLRRQPPPPRHPKPASDASTGEVVITGEAHQTARLLTVADDEANTSTGSTAAATGTEWVPVPPVGELRPTPIRFDGKTHQYLREQGADSKLRGLNVSASAVVRLAMSRLIREVSPQQVNDLLADAVSDQPGPGRKRR